MAYAALLERIVPLSRQKIYGYLADFGGVAKLMPGAVESLHMRGEGIGAVRVVKVQGMEGTLEERLEACIDGRLVSYSLVNDSVLPIDRYHAVVELSDAPGGGCVIRWGSNWIARGAPDVEVRAMLEKLYGQLIDGMLALG